MKNFIFIGCILLSAVFTKAEKIFIRNSVEATIYIKNTIPALQHEDVTLAINYFTSSKAALHYTFSVFYKTIEVQSNIIKLHTNMDGSLLFVDAQLNNIASIQTPTFHQAIESINNNSLDNFTSTKIPYSINKNSYCIFFQENKPSICIKADCYSKSYHYVYFINAQQEIIKSYNYALNLKDTIIQGNVFKPDPLTSSNNIYGGTFVNNNDANATWLTNALVQEPIQASYDSTLQLFVLQNAFAKITDFEMPTFAPVTNTTANFLYNRSQSGFEDCNVLYHIGHLRKHLQTLGYATLFTTQLEIDAHGQFGSDNSVFNRTPGTPTLSLGTGGVNDAEDADVIIHEYAHGLSWAANNNTIFSNERSGLDEGIADYFCTSYSRQMNAFNWKNVFSWDGHNEFWIGRTAVLATDYSATFSGSFYTLGEMWNTAMSRLETSLGATKTNTLMLETLYLLNDNTTLPQAALLILKADSMLYGGIDSLAICTAFKSNKILTNECGAVATSFIQNNEKIELINSLGFAQGISDLVIKFDTPLNTKLTLIDIQGNIVFEKMYSLKNELRIPPLNAAKGIYFIKIMNEAMNTSFKVNKF
jgi:hypothetical protein